MAGLEAHGCLGDTSSTVSILNSIYFHLRSVGSHLHYFFFKYFSIVHLSRTTIFDLKRNSKLSAELQIWEPLLTEKFIRLSHQTCLRERQLGKGIEDNHILH